MARQQARPLVFAQDPELAAQANAFTPAPQLLGAEPVECGDAHLRRVAVIADGRDRGVETPAQLPGGGPAVGAQQQVTGLDCAQHQEVDRPPDDGQSFARARSGYAQDGTLKVPDQLNLPIVQLRMQAEDGGGYGVGAAHVNISPKSGFRIRTGFGTRRIRERRLPRTNWVKRLEPGLRSPTGRKHRMSTGSVGPRGGPLSDLQPQCLAPDLQHALPV